MHVCVCGQEGGQTDSFNSAARADLRVLSEDGKGGREPAGGMSGGGGGMRGTENHKCKSRRQGWACHLQGPAREAM